MPLPPALLERLKRRKIIQEAKPATKAVDMKSGGAERPSTSCDPLHTRYEGSFVPDPVAQTDEQEEIFAADYSDEEKSNHSSDRSGKNDASSGLYSGQHSVLDRSSPQASENDYDTDDEEHKSHPEGLHNTQDLEESVLGCPNKYNIYHDCTRYCKEQHGILDSVVPSLEQRKHLSMILRAFPLTHEWSVVYDPGVKTFYFWNTVTDQVSWFPPGMSTFSSPSADHIRRVMRHQFEQMDD